MRKKAENKIREAVTELGTRKNHRLDHVRPLAGLHPKVFDKTILDMERVGTICLSSEGLEEFSKSEISLLVRRGDTIYVSFTFIDGTFGGKDRKTPSGEGWQETIPESASEVSPDMENIPEFPLFPESEPEPEYMPASGLMNESGMHSEADPVILILQGLFPGEWETFEHLCEKKEKKKALEKIEEMIRLYIRQF